MLIYFRNGDRFINYEAFAYIASVSDSENVTDDSFKVIGLLKNYDRILDLYQGFSAECDRVVKTIVESYRRGDEVCVITGR